MALTRPKYSQIYDSDFKNSARVATTTSVTLSGGAPSTVDGVTLAESDRVLVRVQSTPSQNGIYRVSVVGTGSNGTWVRSLDADTSSKLSPGTSLSIEEGTTLAGKLYRMTSVGPITLGTTEITWTDVSGGGGASTGGTNGQAQYNSNNNLAGATYLYYNSSTGVVTANSSVDSASTSTGALIVVGGVGISGNIYLSGNVVGNSTGAWTIPAGTSAQRPGSASLGMIRYNSTISSFEGFGAGSAWSSLGGVKSVDGKAYITAEASAGAGDDVIRVYSGSTGTSTQVLWASGSNISILPTTVSTSTTSGALIVTGGAGIGGNLYVGGNLSVTGTTIFNNTVVETTTELVQGVSIVAGNLVANSGTASSSTTTGALVVVGGAAVSGELYVGANVTVTGNVLPSANVTYNLGSPTRRWKDLYLSGTTINLNGATISATGGAITFQNSLGGSFSVTGSAGGQSTGTFGNLIANSNVASSSTTTGALQVTGGAGITGTIYAGSIINDGIHISNGNLIATSTVGSTSATTGALVVIGGIGANGAIYSGNTITATGNIVAGSGTSSSSISTGALVVVGGAGISGALHVGSSANFTSGLTASTVQAGTIGNVGAAYTGASATLTGTLIATTVNAGTIGNSGATLTGTLSTAAQTNITSVGTLSGLTVSGAIVPNANLSINVGSTSAWFNTFYGVSTQAKYADLAENYQADAQYVPGTVLVFGGAYEVTTTNQDHNTAVAGIVSTNPAHLMNGTLTGHGVVALGLTGRVPCRVQGPIVKGDVLVTSITPGVAQRIDNSKFLPGCVVGKALESINSSTIETIEVVVGRF